MKFDWSLFNSVDVTRTASLDELSALEKKMKLKLPQSYKEFMLQLGDGIACNHFKVFFPTPNEDFIEESASIREGIEIYLNDLNATGYGGPSDDYEDDVTEDLFRRLIPFCATANGGYLAWDPESFSNDEYRIYFIGYHFENVKFAAANLFDFFEGACSPRVKTMLGFVYEPFQPVFLGRIA